MWKKTRPLLLTMVSLLGLVGLVFAVHVASGPDELQRYWLVALFGGAGGVLSGILRNDNSLHLPDWTEDSKITLGGVGDAAVGLGGATALLFLLPGVLDIETKPMVLVSVSFVAGAVGEPILKRSGQRLLQDVAQVARKATQKPALISLVDAANQSREEFKDPQRAIRLAEEALEYDESYAPARVTKALGLADLGQLTLAVAELDRALEDLPENPDAWYNRACFKAVLGRPDQEVLKDLKEAFRLDPRLKESARTDEDLESIRESESFQALVAHS